MTRALSTGTFLVAVLLYGAASLLYFLEILRKDIRGAASRAPDTSKRLPLPPVLLGAAAAFHLAYVTIASVVAKVCPVDSVHFSLSMSSIFAIASYLVLRRRFRLEALGMLLAPLGLVFLAGTFFLGHPGPSQKLGAVFIALHVVANLAGTALFMLAGGVASLYLVQEKRLKQKRAGGRVGRLPPLEVLDRAEHRFLLGGFPLLTLGVLTGTIWSKSIESGRFGELLRAGLGYATWLLIATMLLLRVAAGWRGRRSAYGTIAAFLFVAAVLAVYLLRPSVDVSSSIVGGVAL